MSITSLSDWGKLELAAQTAELKQVETVKPPTPTTAQQLTFVTTRCAQLQARLRRQQTAMATAQMYLSIMAVDRAREAINRALLDL